MTETWLRVNPRAYWLAILPTATIGLFGLWLVWISTDSQPEPGWYRPAGCLLIAASAVSVFALLWRQRRPRLAHRQGKLLVYLCPNAPSEVPLELVEAFFLGQGPSFLPGNRHARLETMNIVVRLAESAHHLRHVDVNPRLGSWCDGYITLRGTWCEPLNLALANRLNERLAAVKHQATRKPTR